MSKENVKKIKRSYELDEDVRKGFDEYCEDNDKKKSLTVNRLIKNFLKTVRGE